MGKYCGKERPFSREVPESLKSYCFVNRPLCENPLFCRGFFVVPPSAHLPRQDQDDVLHSRTSMPHGNLATILKIRNPMYSLEIPHFCRFLFLFVNFLPIYCFGIVNCLTISYAEIAEMHPSSFFHSQIQYIRRFFKWRDFFRLCMH